MPQPQFHKEMMHLTYPIPLASRKARKNAKFGLNDEISPQRPLNNIAVIRVGFLPNTSARLPHVYPPISIPEKKKTFFFYFPKISITHT